jgi:uncharacterized membrane protein
LINAARLGAEVFARSRKAPVMNADLAAAARAGGPPIHPIIAPVAAAFLIGALATDLLYLGTLSVQWETFSIWLLTAGLIVTLVTAIILLIDLLVARGGLTLAWAPFLAAVAAALLSLINAFIHSRDGYTAVAPSGVALSAIVTLILFYMGWNRWTLTQPAVVAGM